ncbi:hypothetical protein SAMN02745857_01040 [Andreprevotia lacus DSM 23236]|jgi:hypothetical protein|uniref:Uncharacterized protein n=1 Tax=Andreprevotia lacus DSM 23236 TaxID=1121001 RepID=A0A1W1XAA7_9NEIS|nr:hypothetical protein [Andreprevotia lacus]SMC20760.1 hypothetical protein SAMN02745857_01040 [Andreprevotia lacus DSM 23236]
MNEKLRFMQICLILFTALVVVFRLLMARSAPDLISRGLAWSFHGMMLGCLGGFWAIFLMQIELGATIVLIGCLLVVAGFLKVWLAKKNN